MDIGILCLARQVGSALWLLLQVYNVPKGYICPGFGRVDPRFVLLAMFVVKTT